MIFFGLFISKYPKQGVFLKLKSQFSIRTISGTGYIKKLIAFLTRNEKSRLYRFSKKILDNSEVGITMQDLYLLKITSLVVISAVFILIRYTNMDVIKTSIIMKSSQSFNILSTGSTEQYSYNFSLYQTVLKRIGEQTLKKLDNGMRVEAVKEVLPEFVDTRDKNYIEEESKSIVRTYNAVNSIRLIDWKIISVSIFSFWIPEIVLFLRKLLLSNKYKKEVIKLENIFELLAGIKEFKTIQIIDEMGKSSKIYQKHLYSSGDLFKRDKTLGLEALKLSVGNTRFSKLVDVMRVYSLVDKELAVQILERNRLEKEEELLLTAQEDIDIIDVIAFASIIPALFELANLFIKPMMDMIYQAFRFM